MQLCVPVTPAFRLRQERLLDLVDAVTFKEPNHDFFPGKAHFLECSLNIGGADFAQRVESSGLRAALESGKYESFACDLGPNCSTKRGYSPNGFPRALPASAPISPAEYVDRALANVAWLRRFFGGYIQAENLNYFPTGAYETVCNPAFVSEVIRTTGIGLLLDVAHALISAQNLDYADPLRYIEALPLDSVREVHISRSGVLAGTLEDLHEAPDERDEAIVSGLTARSRNFRFLTVEYYRDADRLLKIYQVLHASLCGAPGESAGGRCR